MVWLPQPVSNTFLYMLIFRTHTKFVWKNKMLALGVYFHNPAGATDAGLPSKITLKLLRTTSFVSTKTNSMKCFVNWISLHSHVRLDQTQPCLNVWGKAVTMVCGPTTCSLRPILATTRSETRAPQQLEGTARKTTSSQTWSQPDDPANSRQDWKQGRRISWQHSKTNRLATVG